MLLFHVNFITILMDFSCLVIECDPMIEDMHILVDRLNVDNQFGAFVKSVRNHFKNMCR